MSLGGEWRCRDVDLCLLAASGLSESLLLLLPPLLCLSSAVWVTLWGCPVGRVRGLSGKDEGEGLSGEGDNSPAAWSSMKRPRLPCILLLTVFAGALEGVRPAGGWLGGSGLLEPAVAPARQAT